MGDYMNRDLTFLCEDTIDGIFTAIYKAWEEGTSHTHIQVSGLTSMQLFTEYVNVTTDSALALKVADSIRRKLSPEVYLWCCHTALSDVEHKGELLYTFLRKAFKTGPSIINMLQDNTVMEVFEISRRISREASHYLGFVQFEELSNKVLISRINPRCNIIPLIAPHFADRLHCENWIILDTNRNFCAINSAGNGYVLSYDVDEQSLLSIGPISEKEQEYKDLWKNFFSTIAIDARKNPQLQRNMLPLRFRKYMTLY